MESIWFLKKMRHTQAQIMTIVSEVEKARHKVCSLCCHCVQGSGGWTCLYGWRYQCTNSSKCKLYALICLSIQSISNGSLVLHIYICIYEHFLNIYTRSYQDWVSGERPRVLGWGFILFDEICSLCHLNICIF